MSIGKIVTPCPVCASDMVIRTNGKTHVDFLGCSRFPDCNGRMPLPESIRMERMGAPRLLP